MHFILPYFIILIVIFQFFLRKNSKKTDDLNKEFWKRESDSNSVRKKDISNLNYITIPDDLLAVTSDIPDVTKALDKFHKFSGLTMLNLSGQSNTDLKLEYGPANLDALSLYDENCTNMLRSIVSTAKILNENGLIKEAVQFLEFGIDCHTDITANYTMLAEYYHSKDNKEGIDRLTKTANSLNSINKDSIIKKINSICNPE